MKCFYKILYVFDKSKCATFIRNIFEVYGGFIGQKILKLWRQESLPFGPGWATKITRIRSWTFRFPWSYSINCFDPIVQCWVLRDDWHLPVWEIQNHMLLAEIRYIPIKKDQKNCIRPTKKNEFPKKTFRNLNFWLSCHCKKVFRIDPNHIKKDLKIALG